MVTLKLIKGDITQEDVDVIVNAAHSDLVGGGGVDGAIHKAAGTELLGECINLHGCDIGQARITAGYNLKARYIIHTVGPTWRGGTKNEERDLISCYNHCILLATLQGLHSISFPCISTGAFVFPKDKAAKIAVSTVASLLPHLPKPSLKEVRFVCWDDENYNEYMKLLPTGEGTVEKP